MVVHLPPPAHVGSSNRDDRRPQAGPLPVKRGEIGFEGGAVRITNKDESSEATSSLPPRHPADRDNQSSTRRSFPRSPQVVNEPRSADELSSESFTATKGLFGRLRPKKVPSIGGLQLTTLLLFAIQLIALGGTIAVWAFAAGRVKANLASGQQNSMGTVTAFIHVVFLIIVIGQLVLLERRIYRLRGERYNHLHPGQILPRHRHSPSSSNGIISSAPWNRPPLPTYAVVLAQSGAGTGDVEDNLIAIPPPPAYGNVRGSTLLLHSPRLSRTFSAAVQ